MRECIFKKMIGTDVHPNPVILLVMIGLREGFGLIMQPNRTKLNVNNDRKFWMKEIMTMEHWKILL